MACRNNNNKIYSYIKKELRLLIDIITYDIIIMAEVKRRNREINNEHIHYKTNNTIYFHVGRAKTSTFSAVDEYRKERYLTFTLVSEFSSKTLCFHVVFTCSI